MAWTEFTRRRYEGKVPRYSSDVTDEEWAIVVPRLPGPNRLGRPREINIGAVWDAIQYIASAGCAWSLPPRDFPSVATVRSCFHGCRDTGLLGACLGLLAEINRELVALAREAEGRKCQPTAGVIDSQSAKPSENGGGSGYDAGHRIKGRKHHIMTDTRGHLIAPRVHSASIQDRDGADDALRVFVRLRRETQNRAMSLSLRVKVMPGRNRGTL